MDVRNRAIAKLALANKLPSIGAREYAEAGGLIGYGVNILGLYRRAAYFVDRIFKGAKPSDVPIEQPTRFELIVNPQDRQNGWSTSRRRHVDGRGARGFIAGGAATSLIWGIAIGATVGAIALCVLD